MISSFRLYDPLQMDGVDKIDNVDAILLQSSDSYVAPCIYLPISFRKRERARCSVTPTTSADVFMTSAISPLL